LKYYLMVGLTIGLFNVAQETLLYSVRFSSLIIIT